MALEDLTGTKYIDDLVSSNPTGGDVPDDGDNHIRGVKNVLKLSFPNVDGACSFTPAEANLLASQEGGFLLKGVSTGAGTADAITADFTPNVTLTDGVTVIVRAQGANTVTTPSFAPDGLAAKTIVKGDDSALAIGDIAGASHELILKYNSSNDDWSLLNPVSSGANINDLTATTKTDLVNLSSNLSESTWTTVGPTGSGATYTASAMDGIPLNARHMIVVGYMEGSETVATSGLVILETRVRATGETAGSAYEFINYKYQWLSQANQVVRDNIPYALVPLSSTNTFEALWLNQTNDASPSHYLYVKGWIE